MNLTGGAGDPSEQASAGSDDVSALESLTSTSRRRSRLTVTRTEAP